MEVEAENRLRETQTAVDQLNTREGVVADYIAQNRPAQLARAVADLARVQGHLAARESSVQVRFQGCFQGWI